jgi:hypothetical protein
MYVRNPEGEWINAGETTVDTSWMEEVERIMVYFKDRTPGSFIVRTTTTICWYYSKALNDYGAIQSKVLLIHLWAGPLRSAPAEVNFTPGKVEVRPTGLTVDTQTELFLRERCVESDSEWKSFDMAIVLGDFPLKDEELYTTVQRHLETTRSEHSASQQESGAQEPMSGRSRVPSHTKLCDRASEPDDEISDGRHWTLQSSIMDADDERLRLRKGEWRLRRVSGGNTLQPGFDAGAVVTLSVGQRSSKASFHLKDESDAKFLFARIAWTAMHERPRPDSRTPLSAGGTRRNTQSSPQ